MITLREPAQLADLQGALCVPTYNLTLCCRARYAGISLVLFITHC